MSTYTLVDLFAGAGGMSLGFEHEGFDIKMAVEQDLWASDTYILNHKNKNLIRADIKTLDNSYFEQYKNKVDVVVGGPPCQGFSIAASNRRKDNDDRNVLYKEFLRVVSVIEPKIVIIENVKEIINFKLENGTKIVDDIDTFFDKLGYITDYSIIDCKKYGLPQDRRRFFYLAVRSDFALNRINLDELFEQFLSEEITFLEACSDLPVVRPWEYEENSVLDYTTPPKNEYQREMRKRSIKVYNHIPMKHTKRTVEKFRYLLENENDENLPESLKSRVRGNSEEISKSKFSQNHRIIDANKVSPTITASFYSSFIHPNQPRNLTVREAARMQSFPDDFIFCGKKTTLSKKLLEKKGVFEDLHLDQFNQVGNAVPPYIAKHLANIVKDILDKGE